jgi:hypothetical protein
MSGDIFLGGRQVSGFALSAESTSSGGVSPTYAAAMTGAAAGLAVLVFKGPLWGAVTVFSGVAIATKLGLDRVA